MLQTATLMKYFSAALLEVGKSYIQCVDSVLYAMKYPGSKQVLLRESYPALERSIIRLFLETVPKELYSYNSSKHTVIFHNGSILDFGYCDTEDSVYRYQSQEIDCCRFDEAGHFTQYMYEYLRSRVRGANRFPHITKSTGNPGGPGHVFLRERFVEPSPPMEKFEVKLFDDDDEPETRLFIPCNVYENPFLMKSDPKYIKKLKGLPEQERRQLLEGDWYVFSGQFFPEFSRQIHVIDEIKLEDVLDSDGKPTGKRRYPKDWRMYFSCDYGLDALAGYFIAEDDRGFAYFLGEVYKEGVIISDAAKMIKAKQAELKIPKVDEYLAPSDLWNRRQETGKSAADIFLENGIRLHKATRDRIDGWLAVKEWMKPLKDEQGIETSKLKVHKSCVRLIKCVPLLQYDDKKPGDAATTPHEITHSCVTADTLIRTPSGSVPISEIRVGDKVLSWDGSAIVESVAEDWALTRKDAEVYEIEFDNG